MAILGLEVVLHARDLLLLLHAQPGVTLTQGILRRAQILVRGTQRVLSAGGTS